MENEYLEEYVEDYAEEYINEIIGDEVQKYKEEAYDYLNEIKMLVFTYLILDMSTTLFDTKLDEVNDKFLKKINKRVDTGFKKVDKKMLSVNQDKQVLDKTPYIDKIKDLKFTVDKSENTDYYIKRIKNYYKNTSKTLSKEYIDKQSYLTKKVSKFDKVEKVVPYYSKKTGKIVGYHDLADYKSMVYNTNLTSQAWNDTLIESMNKDNDLVYVPPHPFSCELCIPYQGKFYSITGATKGYPLLEDTLYENGGGLKHPNCKHPIEIADNQVETNDYSTEIWKERYIAKQKKQALQLKKSRLNNDKAIYKKLGNQGEVDKINQRIKKINAGIKEQAEKMKY